MIHTRLHLHAIATWPLLLGVVTALPTGYVLAQNQDAQTSPDDANAKVLSLLAQIESALVKGDKPLDNDITEKLVAATALLPHASPQTTELLKGFPARLHNDAETVRRSGDLVKAINLDVFADASDGFLKEHAPKPETPKPSAPQRVATAVPAAPAPAAPAPASSPLVQQERALVERGDAMLRLGDVSAARMLFERAAGSGLGIAALKLADTYDADFLADHNLRGVKPDPAAAEEWYRKAAALGEASAANRLKALEGNRLANLLSTQ